MAGHFLILSCSVSEIIRFGGVMILTRTSASFGPGLHFFYGHGSWVIIHNTLN
jgi:hypothetical protein